MPLVGSHTVSDPYIQSFKVDGLGYLQTSPEYYLKKLLSNGSGDVYSLGKAFRAGEQGSKHRPEFLMLEWYRVGYGLPELAEDIARLLSDVSAAMGLAFPATQTLTYRTLFESAFGTNPHEATVEDLVSLATIRFPQAIQHLDNPDRSNVLDVLFSLGVEPDLIAPTFVTEFPACQASLANIAMRRGDQVALRVELYWRGVELANGYDELRDSEQLRKRIEVDNLRRQQQQLELIAPDESLLTSMQTLPKCAGVALGVERLLMLLMGETTLDSVLVDQ